MESDAAVLKARLEQRSFRLGFHNFQFPFMWKKKMSSKPSMAVSSTRRPNRRVVTLVRKPTILVAEDSVDSLEMMQILLRSKGYRVLTAENGVRALQVAVRKHPDAVLLDLQLPKLDGLSVTRNLRLNPLFKKIPIIILSGHDPRRYRQEAIEAGSNEYLLKPIDFDRLQVLLDQLVPLDRQAQFRSF